MLFKNRDRIIENGQTEFLKRIRRDILDIFSFAIDAVNPYNSVYSRFKDGAIDIDSKKIYISDFKNIYLIGFGKASIGMAKAVCDSVNIKNGIIVTNDVSARSINANIKIYVASHPIPEVENIDATDEILKLINKCEKDDLLIVLISGGGSALLCKPRVDLNDIKITTDLLLGCGANIKEINTVRKHLSHVKGGQLARISNCRMVSLIISDVIDDPIEFIASGPTCPDSTTFKDTKDILEKYKVYKKLPCSVFDIIEKGLRNEIPENPKKDHPIFNKVDNLIVANNILACTAAEKKARELGYATNIFTNSLKGEARDVGISLIEKILDKNVKKHMFAFISGGETTVTIKGKGKGGRNQEMVLSTVNLLSRKNIVFSSFATDGIDGMSNAAGAIADFFTLKKATDMKLDPEFFLENNNSNEFFDSLGDLLITGPTGTNVMDIQVLIKME